MKLLSFNFTKIHVERNKDFTSFPSKMSSPNVDFIDVVKEKSDLIADDILKILFKFSVSYKLEKNKKEEDFGEVVFDGQVVFSADKKESKDMLASWKKKELPSQTRVDVANLILKKCSVKALGLEDEIGLPFHFGLPQITEQQPQKAN